MAEINLLSTRPVNEALIRDAAAKGIQIDVLSLIETRQRLPKPVVEQIRSIAQQYSHVVFTSMNAVEAVGEALQGITPKWLVYCIGNTTRHIVEAYWGSSVVAGYAEDAARLAGLITAEGKAHEIIFFCGDHRRPELPDHLLQHGLPVREVVVYETIPQHQLIKKTYDAILFYSPSAVDSFFYNNRILPNQLLFAIGNTTAAAIRKHGPFAVITANKPGKEILLRQAIDYFSTGKESLKA